MRSFIALTLPDDLKWQIQEVQNSIRTTSRTSRITKTDQLHLTLAFMEDFPGEKEEECIRWLEALRFSPPLLTCISLRSMHARSDKLIYLSVEGSQELRALCDMVRKGLKNLGIHHDTRPARFHITVARGVRGFDRERCTSSMTLPSPAPALSLSLFSSTLSRQGANHTLLAKNTFSL